MHPRSCRFADGSESVLGGEFWAARERHRTRHGDGWRGRVVHGDSAEPCESVSSAVSSESSQDGEGLIALVRALSLGALSRGACLPDFAFGSPQPLPLSHGQHRMRAVRTGGRGPVHQQCRRSCDARLPGRPYSGRARATGNDCDTNLSVHEHNLVERVHVAAIV